MSPCPVRYNPFVNQLLRLDNPLLRPEICCDHHLRSCAPSVELFPQPPPAPSEGTAKYASILNLLGKPHKPFLNQNERPLWNTSRLFGRVVQQSRFTTVRPKFDSHCHSIWRQITRVILVCKSQLATQQKLWSTISFVVLFTQFKNDFGVSSSGAGVLFLFPD